MSVLTVISHYRARSRADLEALLASLLGAKRSILVVENDDRESGDGRLTSINSVPTLIRKNLGMNIGAWDSAYRAFPNFDHYIFLQDECVLVEPNYETRYITKLSLSGHGMTGESINPKWVLSWSALMHSPLNYPIVNEFDGNSTDRVTYYLNCLRGWGIDAGSTAAHLRALAWGFTNECLRAINGFPIGRNKEECIAAEIAVSRKVVELGFDFSQIDKNHFACFGHREWRSDGYSKVQ
jgi:hypothetical protein